MYDLVILIDAFIFVVPFCVLSYISQKFHDNFGLRDEIKTCVIIFAVGVVIFIAGYFLLLQWVPSPADTILRSQGSYALQTIVAVLLVMRVLYVPRLYEHLHKVNAAPKLRLRLASRHSDDRPNNDAVAPAGPALPKLTDVLKCEEGFKLFADHLLKEYSVEALLFLLELTQIKRSIIKHYHALFSSVHGRRLSDLQEGFERGLDSMTFKLDIHPNILQLSDDVSKNITLAKVVDLWTYLYEQYITESALSAINISYEVRVAIWTQINKKKEFIEQIIERQNRSHMNLQLNVTHAVAVSASQSSANLSGSSTPVPQISGTPNVSNSSDSGSLNMLGRFGTKKEWHALIMQLMISFDRAAKEVYHSLENDSWLRFKSSEAYRQWKEQIFDPAHQTRKFTIASMTEKLMMND
eukprot:CAMPEP_0202687394 /NCGR_PEP_ID=MMETSP1385-20130828/3080_1 /ASSEMBLY_ACC=CAM_ASM_000861 /TAXON_ID=933848 /ORGANISM="Elphidium margaritaceum" /LENGTH=409 /DNA_ID=CAMNT_0049342177 /DNA_START=570 /DNA_END=1799 /DNA_ORIENTATION=+